MSELPKIDESRAVPTSGGAIAPVVDALSKPAPQKRRMTRAVLMLALPALLLAGGGYWWVTGGRYEETENANLRQAKVTIASELSGRVVETHVTENAHVKGGDVLFVVDPEPYRIALAQADAALATARLNVEQLRAAYQQAVVQLKMTTGDVTFLESEVQRSTDLAGKGFSSKSSLNDIRHDLAKAKDQELASEQARSSALAALGGDPEIETDRHPAVLAALAARDKAAYALTQTEVRAPADGIVSQASSFRIGQYVAPGSAVFSLIETGDAWIEANFKETQLANMKIGQQAEVVLDTFPDRPLKATVEGIGAGTGAEFSLLPAQNATGNWVKVTQRIPVRLKVEARDDNLPIRTGMSATVTIDTGKSRGIPAIFGTAFADE